MADDDFEIYNIVKDPQQLNNLASNAGMVELQEKMKAGVLQRRMPNSTAPRPYDNTPVPDVVAENAKEGVSYNLHIEDFSWVPDVSKFMAQSNGIIAKPDLNVIKSRNAPFQIDLLS